MIRGAVVFLMVLLVAPSLVAQVLSINAREIASAIFASERI